MDRASATETVDEYGFDSQSGQTKCDKKLVFVASLLDGQK